MNKILKSTMSIVFAIIILFSLTTNSLAEKTKVVTSKNEYIDNSSLIPKYVTDEYVTLDQNNTPTWVDGLIIAEVRIDTATEEGTLESAISVLDHYAEMGVNGIWVTPVYDPGNGKPGSYSGLGPHTIDPQITGEQDYALGWQKMKWFVDEAHKRNIRIILDVISWGTVKGSKLYEEHPDWYTGSDVWGGDEFNFDNSEFVEWYINQIVNIALITGCDGFRYDVEPSYAGYEVDGAIKDRLLEQGRKIFTMSEHKNDRGLVYDTEQGSIANTSSYDNYNSLIPNHWYLNKYNIVDAIKNGIAIGSNTSQVLGIGGQYKYYTYCMSNHDNKYPVANANRVAVGYQMIYAPFIPIFYIGEEWNNPKTVDDVLFFNKIDWEKIDDPENRRFYEDMKKMIRVRRQYPNIFANFAEQLIDTNICTVNVTGCESQAYARYQDDTAILVIPNYNVHDKNAQMTVYMPFVKTGLDYYKTYTITDAITGEVIVSGGASAVAKFKIQVPYEEQRVFVVKAENKLSKNEVSDNLTSIFVDPDNQSDYLDSDSEKSNDNTTSVYEETIRIKRPKTKSQNRNFPIIPVVASIAVLTVISVVLTVFIIVKRKKKLK